MSRRGDALASYLPHPFRTFSRSGLWLLPMLIWLSGCGSGHHQFEVAANPKTADGASIVDMLVVTTRAANFDGGHGCSFSGERGRNRTICNVVVSIPPDRSRAVGQIQWSKGTAPDPQTDFTTLRADPIESEKLDGWFRAVAGRKHRLFVFVHGFNTNFDEAVYRLAQVVHDSRMDVAPVLFSWPSRGGALSYVYDNASAAYSRDALAYFLEKADQDPNVSDIVVMAHSLGNWLMMEALRQTAVRNGHVSGKIRNVVMAAPDIDVDVFRAQLGAMGQPLPRTTILVSRDDKALAISRILAGGIDRVGAANPDLPKYASQLGRYRIEVVDLTKVKDGDPLHHAKFAASPEVVRQIGKRIIEGQSMDQRMEPGKLSLDYSSTR